MNIAIDTSVLVDAERGQVDLIAMLAQSTDAFYLPVMARAEWLVGLKLVKGATLIRAQQFKMHVLDQLPVFAMESNHADLLAALIAEARRKGRTIKPYDAAIAAQVLAEAGKTILCSDDDYTGVSGINIIRP